MAPLSLCTHSVPHAVIKLLLYAVHGVCACCPPLTCTPSSVFYSQVELYSSEFHRCSMPPLASELWMSWSLCDSLMCPPLCPPSWPPPLSLGLS